MRITRRKFGKMMGTLPAFGVFDSLPSLAKNAIGPGAASIEGPTTDRRQPWYETNRRWTLFNIHFLDWDPLLASRLDPTEIVSDVVTSNANVFWMYAMDCLGNAYYPTRVGHKHRNLPDKDLMGEVVTGCKRNGIAIVLYYCINWNRYAAEHHPEWSMKDNKNETPGYGVDLGPYLCYNAPGYLDYVKRMTTEMLEYDPDGLFYDMVWFGQGNVCYCQENCQRLFRNKYGIDMPLAPTWDDAWRKFLEFRYDSNIRFAQEVTAHAHQARANVSVGYNYHGQPRLSWQNGMQPVRHRQISDYGGGETFQFLGGQWFPSLITTFVRGLKPGSPAALMTPRCLGGGYSDFTLRPEADLKWEVFTFLSHGTHACVIDDAVHDGSLQRQVYERLGRIYSEVKEKERYFGQQHVREVGLYYSLKSRDWYGREKQERYQDAFVGAHRALSELHIPVDAVFDETVALETLQNYPLIFLANTAILDQNEVSIFRDYVKRGGKLIATLDTSLYDLDGNPLSDYTLGDVLGIRYKGKAAFSTHYYRLPQGFFSVDIMPGWDISIPGVAHLAESAGAEAHGELKLAFYEGPPFHTLGQSAHNSPWKTVAPAVFLNRFGQGQAAYIPFAPDAAYVGEFPLPEHRIFLRNLIRYLYPNPEVRVDAPLNVEAVITEEPALRQYIIHFIACQPGRDIDGVNVRRRPTVMEDTPLYRAQIHLQQRPRQVSSLGKTTQVAQKENTIALQIEEIHETVIISY